MKTIYDNINAIGRADDRFILEEDVDGLLYETSNAASRQLVCAAMFATPPKLEDLCRQFPEDVARRYLEAANDSDK